MKIVDELGGHSADGKGHINWKSKEILFIKILYIEILKLMTFFKGWVSTIFSVYTLKIKALYRWFWIHGRTQTHTLLGGHSWRAGAVEVDVLPFAVTAVPDTGLLGLHGARHIVDVHVLGEPYISDARRVLTDQVYVRVQQDGVDGFVAFGES